jgi:hypothetical protein
MEGHPCRSPVRSAGQSWLSPWLGWQCTQSQQAASTSQALQTLATTVEKTLVNAGRRGLFWNDERQYQIARFVRCHHALVAFAKENIDPVAQFREKWQDRPGNALVVVRNAILSARRWIIGPIFNGTSATNHSHSAPTYTRGVSRHILPRERQLHFSKHIDVVADIHE